jgi:hypothetical protein
MSYGQFSAGGNPYVRTYDCFGQPAGTISHNTAKHYFYQVFYWTAPTNLQSDLRFYGTVVHETEEFYVGLSSGRIAYDANCADGQLSALSFEECDFGPCDPLPSGASGQTSSAIWAFMAALVLFKFCS